MRPRSIRARAALILSVILVNAQPAPTIEQVAARIEQATALVKSAGLP